MENSESYFGSGEARACLRARTGSAYKQIDGAKSPLPKYDLFNLTKCEECSGSARGQAQNLAAQDGTIEQSYPACW
jgi:hypothetical protein